MASYVTCATQKGPSFPELFCLEGDVISPLDLWPKRLKLFQMYVKSSIIYEYSGNRSSMSACLKHHLDVGLFVTWYNKSTFAKMPASMWWSHYVATFDHVCVELVLTVQPAMISAHSGKWPSFVLSLSRIKSFTCQETTAYRLRYKCQHSSIHLEWIPNIKIT